MQPTPKDTISEILNRCTIDSPTNIVAVPSRFYAVIKPGQQETIPVMEISAAKYIQNG